MIGRLERIQDGGGEGNLSQQFDEPWIMGGNVRKSVVFFDKENGRVKEERTNWWCIKSAWSVNHR